MGVIENAFDLALPLLSTTEGLFLLYHVPLKVGIRDNNQVQTVGLGEVGFDAVASLF